MAPVKNESLEKESIMNDRSSIISNRRSVSERTTTNIPLELWRVVFSYLSIQDLCRCCQICKDWNELVQSLDSTRWKELFLQQKSAKRWKHPNWPNSTHIDPKSWRTTYRIHSLASKQWMSTGIEVSCSLGGGLLSMFRNKNQRKVIHVGPGRKYLTINRALSAAKAYDRIVLDPGHYQQFPLSLKFPIEIVGFGDPGKVGITMLIEHTAPTARIANVVLRPSYPRQRGRGGSSSVLIKVLCGHLQLDNCQFEQGQLHVCAPGSVNIRYCSFNSAHICFKGVVFSNVNNCKFKPDRVAVTVEEPSLSMRMRHMPAYVGGWAGMLQQNNNSIKDYYLNLIKLNTIKSKASQELERLGGTSQDSINSSNQSKEFIRENYDNYEPSKGMKPNPRNQSSDKFQSECFDNDTKSLLQSIKGIIITNCKIESGRGGVTICRMGHAWIEDNVISGMVYGIRCVQSSKVVLLNNKIHNCETSAVFMREHSIGLIAGNHIFNNNEAGIDLRSNANPIVQHNHIYSGRRSGIVCLDNGRGLIRDNDIYNNKEAGVYILYKGNPDVKYNRIWTGRAAGVAVTEEGKGHITHNDICGMEWAGIDIRNGGDPVVSHNVIRKGQADGVIIGEGAKSVLYDNDIQGNNGCGIWILDGAQPLIHTNRISDCGDSGIAFVSNSDMDHDYQQLHAQFLQQEQHQDIAEIADSSEDEEFVPPVHDIEEPESRFILVSRPDKKLAQVEYNKITRNRGHGILYSGTDGVVVSRNTISHNNKHGVVLTRPAEITIQDNNIAFNSHSGISVHLGVCCTVQGNGIYHNKEYGLQTAGVGIIKENDIFGHHMSALLIRIQGDPHVAKNRLQGLQQECICVEEGTRGLIENNEIYHYSFVSPLSRHQDSQVQISKNNYIILSKNDNDGLETSIDLKYLNLQNPSPRPLMDLNPNARGLFFQSPAHINCNGAARKNIVISRMCTIL
eukprot:gene12332-13605_t